MAYIIVVAGGEEIDRLELQTGMIVGRSPECDLRIRDVLLSRRHCQLEQQNGGWRVIDLTSKNGTRIGWERISNAQLYEGDILRIGRTCLIFKTGDFEPSAAPPRRTRLVRPADPFEALAGTVSGFVLDDQTDPVATPVTIGEPVSFLNEQDDNQPIWAVDLPAEARPVTMAVSSNPTLYASCPTSQPRRAPCPQPKAMLAASAVPASNTSSVGTSAAPLVGQGQHRPVKLKSVSVNSWQVSQRQDRRQFLAIFSVVAMLTSAVTLLGTWWVSV
ncbi:MAG: FHA domain-containing protein [Phycisphaerales bacterium]|nr:FHA domain-containing protein [Phycisphaerales bacterium]